MPNGSPELAEPLSDVLTALVTHPALQNLTVQPYEAACFQKIRGMTLAAAGTSIQMRPSIPKAVERKDMAVAGALLIRRRGAAAAAAEGATRDA